MSLTQALRHAPTHKRTQLQLKKKKDSEPRSKKIILISFYTVENRFWYQENMKINKMLYCQSKEVWERIIDSY